MSSERLEDTPQLLDELIQKCFKAKEKAYSPYSKFRVGAALLTNSGQIFTGIKIKGLALHLELTDMYKDYYSGSPRN